MNSWAGKSCRRAYLDRELLYKGRAWQGVAYKGVARQGVAYKDIAGQGEAYKGIAK